MFIHRPSLLARRAACTSGPLLLQAGLLANCILAAVPDRLSYNEHIRPILSDRCFSCHGPDEQKREADLRLDERDGATRDLGGHAAIVPSKSDESELIARVVSEDPDVAMPPPAAKKPHLTSDEVALLKKWIEQGAEYEGHWSLQPMRKPVPPQLSPANETKARNDVDRFVLQKIEEKQAETFAAEAPRERWLRRVTFDLTGLPPTPAELDAFAADQSPEAFEGVVDRLLASPRYGERLASEWLDIARFADTHGYQLDRFRPMWAYRDWVIKALNQNLPYDQFVTWQLAGDLLPQATKEQRLATAFNRLHCQNEEGGIVAEEFRVAYINDRVTTFGTAFLGLTLECTRCHDHKFDPVTQRDYYSLFAFFQNIDESGQTSFFTGATPTPSLLLSTDEQDARLANLRRAIDEAESHVQSAAAAADEAFANWLRARPTEPQIQGCTAHFPFDQLDRGKTANIADVAKPGAAVEGPQIVAGKQNSAVELNGENGFTFGGVGDFSRSDPFSFTLWLRSPAASPRAVVLHHSKAPADAASRGYEILLEEGHVVFGLSHFWPGNAIRVRSKAPIAAGEWTHIGVTYDGSSRAAGMKVYVNGKLASLNIERDHLWKDIRYDGGEPPLTLGHRFRDNGFKGGGVDELRVFNRALTPLEVADIAGDLALRTTLPVPIDALSPTQLAELREYFLANHHQPWQEATQQLKAARDAERTFVNPIAEAMVMQEMPQPKPAFILARGNYDQPSVTVAAATPAALPPLPVDAQPNRLALARWLTDPEHPLFPRVAVNRYWQMMFGRGIVETSDNFGLQGANPTHPDLLDWLARDFIASGWDTKALLRKLALSATYRQDSRASVTALAQDPDNRYFTRYPTRNLTAEMLRDQALATSGLLVEKLGGPSVKPYQPARLWDIAASDNQYPQEHGENLYRRSLYTYWRRTIPPPAMAVFDAADRSYCTVRRQSTSTPLQALALVNDPQIVEAARFAGQRMLKEGGVSAEQQLAWLFRLVTSRQPAAREQSILQQLFREQHEIFAADAAATDQFLAVGESKPDSTLDKSQLAAASVVALSIINHDEAVRRR